MFSDGIRFFAVLPLCVALSGCMSFDLFAPPADNSLTTKSITPAKSTETISDEVTVRNAVTSADLTKLAGASLPWANASTGSAGVVASITESRANGAVCRSFVTTRHAYDGIANFTGDACLDTAGEWKLIRFIRQN